MTTRSRFLSSTVPPWSSIWSSPVPQSRCSRKRQGPQEGLWFLQHACAASNQPEAQYTSAATTIWKLLVIHFEHCDYVESCKCLHTLLEKNVDVIRFALALGVQDEVLLSANRMSRRDTEHLNRDFVLATRLLQDCVRSPKHSAKAT